jgi:3-phenylpropionate/trans-cinnamate dioxygenase ferredoxin component
MQSHVKSGNTNRFIHIVSTDSQFITLCPLADLECAVPRTFEVDDQFVLLVRYQDDVYCIEDVCTHDGGTLGDGELDGHCITCPRHGAKFDVRTGEAVTMPATEPTKSYEVKIDAGMVAVRLVDK